MTPTLLWVRSLHQSRGGSRWLEQLQPESPGDRAPTVSGCIDLALGLLDDWLAGNEPSAPAGIGHRVALPAVRWRGDRAASDILALARKGHAFRSLATLIVTPGGENVLHGSALTLAAAVRNWAADTDTSASEILLNHVRWPTTLLAVQSPRSNDGWNPPNATCDQSGELLALARLRRRTRPTLHHRNPRTLGRCDDRWKLTPSSRGAVQVDDNQRAMDGLFVGRLDRTTAAGRLVRNLLAGAPAEDRPYGALADADIFRGWQAFIAEQSLAQLFESSVVPTVHNHRARLPDATCLFGFSWAG